MPTIDPSHSQEGEKFSARELFKTEWKPKAVKPPVVDPQIEKLSPLQRSAEVVRYSVLSIEFWISPNGQVREWLRNNLLLAVILAIPAFFVLPTITFALWQFVSWLVALVAIAGNLIVFPVLALLAVAVIAVAVMILKAIFSKQ